MKHRTSLSIAAILISAWAAWPRTTQAQLLNSFGVKAGPTFSSFSSNMFTEDLHRRTGLSLLLFAGWFEEGLLSLEAEAGYVQRGFATKHELRDAQNNPVGSFKRFERFDYFSGAALAKLRYRSSVVVPYAVAGPRLELLLGGDPDDGLVQSYRSWAAGGTVGLGAEVRQLLIFPMLVQVRYNFDVTNSLSGYPRSAYNNAFDVLLGVKLLN